MEVMATAYNSLPSQTDWNHPTLAAWGDTLEPGIKCIAVSRDLIQMGLSHKAEVTIEGFPGSFLVLDKMNKRHKKSIDIYMGVDRTAANQWGKQKVIISWKVSKY
jgi:3D (Asp-Asp-Asp) domain-containing protein